MPLDLEAIRRDAENPVAATPLTVDAAADDFAAAFHDDPLFTWFMRDDHKRDAARRRFFRVLMRESILRDGVIERPRSGGAAAAWIPSENLGPQPLWLEIRALPMLLGATGLGRFSRLLALREAMEKHHPMHEPHDYLYFLGVRPDVQGAGVGSRLLKAHTQRLDAEGRVAWLETATPRNVPLYQRHGFVVETEYSPGEDGPLTWGMRRAPQMPQG